MQAAHSSPQGARLRFRSLEEPRRSRRVVVCSVRLQPGLELMRVVLMFYREALRIKGKQKKGTNCLTTGESKSIKSDVSFVESTWKLFPDVFTAI